MKKIFILLAIALGTVGTTFAQSAAKTDLPGVPPIEIVKSKAMEMEAAVSRNRQDLLPQIFSEAASYMTQVMTDAHKRYTESTGSAKEQLKKKMDKLQNLYSEAKLLSIDPKKNDKALLDKMKAFIEQS